MATAEARRKTLMTAADSRRIISLSHSLDLQVDQLAEAVKKMQADYDAGLISKEEARLLLLMAAILLGIVKELTQ